MRNPARLEYFYKRMEELHRMYCPDWRVAQLLMNFFGWLGTDPFYWEDSRLLEKLEQYFKETFFD